MGLYIAGSVFLLLTMLWAFIQWKAKKNEKFEEAKRDYKKAIDDGNRSAVLDAERRMLFYK